jgi:patatin-like phospholipase/acyl hydrolase
MAKQIRMLSIDGGGIRGVIPAMVLAEIERRTGKHISELFDLITGTSTGGILALALTRPNNEGTPRYSAEDLISLYEENGGRIFSRSLWHRIQAVGNIAEVKYTSEGIETVLDECFGETRLSQALTEVLVTSYEIERHQPFLFRSYRARKSSADDFPMKVAARATSAAPTYFEPCKLEIGDPSEYYALIDGLVFASNPTLCGFVEAKNIFPATDDFLVVSLGTGEVKGRYIYDEVKDWGAFQWTQPLLDIVLHGISMTIDYQMKQLLPPKDDGTRYYRFQAQLDSANAGMDDTDPSNLRTLRLLAEELIRENDNLLDSICSRLTHGQVQR